jgi:glycosyltransferase involved in cell wall biosynthesis
MRVVQVNFFVSAPENLPSDILCGTPALVNLAAATCEAGAEVHVIQGCGHDEHLTRQGVDFHFVRPAVGERAITGSARFAALVRELRTDVFHVHGLAFCSEVLELARLAPGTPLLVQDHADRVPRPWRRTPWRVAARHVSGYSFCAMRQSEPFARAGLLRPEARVFEIPEASSDFQPGDHERARRTTGLHGDPALLWVGHLDSNKDPLTVLDGFAQCSEQLPHATLWCCFVNSPLLGRVERRIARDPRLRDRVHLLGRQSREAVQALMQAADLFVIGSHREGSGYSLMEAMATGLPAVVTDIPSFRALTAGEPRAYLWKPGDAQSFRGALLSAHSARRADTRSMVRAHFDRYVSYSKVGRRFVQAYGELRV